MKTIRSLCGWKQEENMKTLEELQEIRNRIFNQVDMRQDNTEKTRVVVGMATCGIAAGARPVLKAFSDAVAEKDMGDVVVAQTGCIGMCRLEPIVEVYVPGEEKVTYIKMTPEKAAEVVEQHLINKKVVTKYTIGNE